MRELITRPAIISLIFSGRNNKISFKYNVLYARRYSSRSICKIQYPDDLKHLAKEIFVGYPNKSKVIKKTSMQKLREYFVIEIMA